MEIRDHLPRHRDDAILHTCTKIFKVEISISLGVEKSDRLLNIPLCFWYPHSTAPTLHARDFFLAAQPT